MASTTANDDHDIGRKRPLSSAPSVASIGPYTGRPYISQRSQPGPSASARTSFTRVGPEEEEGPLFPARPATASASVATPQLQLLRPRLFDLPSAESATSLQIDAEADNPDPDAPADPTMLPSSVPPSPPQPQPAAVPQTPQTYITFLLVTGRRRTMSFEPETTVGRVKELVWNTWPEEDEWRDERPPAPSYLRLLYLGKMLQDDDTLTKLKLPVSNPSSPQATIVHLSIRPHAPTGETDGLKKKRKLPRRLSGDETSDPTGCCGCIIC
ncbi:hypothetical protein APHAL10511_008513 [Amanita phalloides]|nr:hypothetical protein APHAL10511_008513 [Amanita phalloides]